MADLHTHLFGCISAADFREFLLDKDVDWGVYRANFRQAYGQEPPVAEILERCRTGMRGADSEFERLFVFGDDDAGNFGRFQAKYDMLIHGMDAVRYSSEEASMGEISMPTLLDGIGDFIHKIMARQRREGVGYIEQRMTLGSKYTPKQAQELVLGILRTYEEYEGSDVEARLAISLPRDNPWDAWEVVRSAALGPLGHLLTAIDFSYFEDGHPPKKQREILAEVRDFNRRHPERALAVLYHVGESFDDKSLESAVRWVHEAAELGAHRLGHAISLGVDPARFGNHTRTETVAERIDQLNYDLAHRDGLAKFGVEIAAASVEAELRKLDGCGAAERLAVEYDDDRLEEVRRRQRYAIDRVRALGAVIEVCPTSNRRIGGIDEPEHHPVREFLASGAPFVVATDDPGIFGTTLAREMVWVAEHNGLADDAVDHIAEMAWASRSEVLTSRI